MKKIQQIRAWLFTAPFWVWALLFVTYPIVWSIWLSFHKWNIISPAPTFVGFKNFAKTISSERVFRAFINSYRIMAVFVPLSVIVSLSIALLINSVPKLKRFFSLAYFLPLTTSSVAFALIFTALFSRDSFITTSIESMTGYHPLWFLDPRLAFLLICLLIVFKLSGYYALIFLAALQGIPSELYEAAEIDGAGIWAKFRYITIPMLYPAFYVVLILAVGLCFGIFTEPYILTGGGPGLATQTWVLEMYFQAFSAFNAGYASAVGILNAVATLGSVLLVKEILEGWGKRHGFI